MAQMTCERVACDNVDLFPQANVIVTQCTAAISMSRWLRSSKRSAMISAFTAARVTISMIEQAVAILTCCGYGIFAVGRNHPATRGLQEHLRQLARGPDLSMSRFAAEVTMRGTSANGP
jgi:hypothetical protein